MGYPIRDGRLWHRASRWSSPGRGASPSDGSSKRACRRRSPRILAPDLPTLMLRCQPFGRPAMLVLFLPVEASSLLAAFWTWRRRRSHEGDDRPGGDDAGASAVNAVGFRTSRQTSPPPFRFPDPSVGLATNRVEMATEWTSRHPDRDAARQFTAPRWRGWRMSYRRRTGGVPHVP